MKVMRAEDDVIFFLHLPKTAGVSLIAILDPMFEESEILPLHSDSYPELFEIYSREQIKRFRFVRGHFEFGPFDEGLYKHIVQNPICITLLREPVSRVISAYRHIMRKPKIEIHPHKIHVEAQTPLIEGESEPTWESKQARAVRKMTLREFACHADFFRSVYNRQTQMILGALNVFPKYPGDPDGLSEPALLQLAMDRLEQFAFIGLTEQFKQSVELLAYCFDWEPVTQVPVLNVDPEPINLSVIPEDALDAIRERTRIDRKLYQFASDLFEERWEDMQRDLNRDESA